MTSPRLTLVIAAHNAQATLAKAIESVLRQEYDNWELLVVDDGSTDRTLEVARACSGRDVRIKVLAQANTGAGAARNAAIRCADGDFIGYLDADDTLADEYMSAMLELMRANPGFDIYSSDGVFVHDDGSREPVFGYKRTVQLRIEDLLEECLILGGGALVRVEVLKSLGGFRERIYGEDYDLWLRALATGYTHIASPRPLYVYHRNVEGQKSEDFHSGYASAVAAISHLIESGILTPAQERIACASLANYTVGPQLEEQAQRFRVHVERVFGKRLAGPVMSIVHSVSWIVRPVRRALAGKRRTTSRKSER